MYIAGRRVERADKAIGEMKTAHPDSKGRLEYLQLDLGDLASIKTSANAFLEKEQRLDVLWNNAGVMGGRQDAPDTKQVIEGRNSASSRHAAFVEPLTHQRELGS